MKNEQQQTFSNYREKAMELWRELLSSGETTREQLQNSYFQLFIKKTSL